MTIGPCSASRAHPRCNTSIRSSPPVTVPSSSHYRASPSMTSFTLDDLARIVAERAAAPATESYTAKLIGGGPAKAAKKLGEEAVEAAIAAVQGDRPNLTAEAADV